MLGSRRWGRFSGPLVIALGLMSPIVAYAQFGMVAPTTSGRAAEAITGAIHGSVGMVLAAKPVIDMQEVSVVNAMAIGGADRRVMITGMVDGSVAVWDLFMGRQQTRQTEHKGAALAVAAGEDGKTGLSGGSDGLVVVWSLDAGVVRASVADGGTDGAVGAVAVSKDGRMGAAGYGNGTTRIIDLASGKVLKTVKGPKGGAVTTLAFDEGGMLAAGTDNGTISLIDAKSGKVGRQLTHGARVTGLAFLPQGRLASAGMDGEGMLWTVRDGKSTGSFKGGMGGLTSLAVSADGGRIVAGTGQGMVTLFDAATGAVVKSYEGHTATINSVAFGRGDAVIHTASADGTSRVFNRDEAQELAQVVAGKDGSWSAFNKDGMFDGEGQNAVDSVAWQSDDLKFEMDQFTESHYEPGVLATAAEGRKTESAAAPKLSVEFAMPPEVAIASPSDNATVDSSDAEVSVAITNKGGGIQSVRVYQNDRLVAEKAYDDTSEESVSEDFDVKLLPGDNKFRVVALSTSHIESRPAKASVRFTGAELASTLHVVTVGINQYKNPALNLSYGVADAQGLTEFFGQQPKKLFKEIREYQLRDAQATKENIRAMLGNLRETNPEDVVVLYLAGHGETVGKDWYFLPHETIYPEREDHIREKGIRSSDLDEMVQDVGAQKVVMLMDSCKSGASLANYRGFEERKALSSLARSSGIHVMASASKDQFAVELAQLGHGAFTYTLLSGLKGEADNNHNGAVSVRELSSYIEEKLPELSARGGGNPQFPVINSQGQDFPIAVGQ